MSQMTFRRAIGKNEGIRTHDPIGELGSPVNFEKIRGSCFHNSEGDTRLGNPCFPKRMFMTSLAQQRAKNVSKGTKRNVGLRNGTRER